MIDYRSKEHRRESFVRWFAWSVVHDDCDPSLYMLNYLFDRFEFNTEQRYWVSFLYGTTYQLPTAWVIANEFPDFELVDQSRLVDWNNLNYKRLRYQTDMKWNKGHLPAQYESYRNWILTGFDSQRERFADLCRFDSATNYRRVFAEASKIHKFGRYSTWFYLQTLKHCTGLDIEPSDLILEDESGSRSHRNGLLYALGRENMIDVPFKEISGLEGWLDELNVHAQSILEEVKREVPVEFRHRVDFFAMETCCCSFRKIFRKRHGRYLGYYIARQSEEINKVQADGWNGICWRPFWDARKETLHENLQFDVIDEDRMSEFLDTGTISLLEMMYVGYTSFHLTEKLF